MSMDIKEAIKRIKDHNRIHAVKEYPFAIKITEALDMAIEALEKQTPKKVKKEKHITVHNPFGLVHNCLDFIVTHHCPNCNHCIQEYEDSGVYPQTRNDYCNVCGQALKWK